MSANRRNAWTTSSDIKERLRRRWQRGDILASSLREVELFPLCLPIKGPTSTEIVDDFDKVRDWIAAWRTQSPLRCEWREFSHRLLGRNSMPSAVVIPDAESAARILGLRKEWDAYQATVDHCRECFPELLPWLAKRPHVALELSFDWPALLAVVSWVRDHPRSGFYLRQIDAPGVHSKLVERHRGVLSELLDLALPSTTMDFEARGTSGFNRRYGFREKPERVRLRSLDPACAIAPARLGLDLTLNADAFAALDPPVERVFITENEVNFLAFPDCPRSLILFGAGYGWSALAAADWLHRREIRYWGDVDTHGFAILDQLRSHFPHVQSLLMTREILLRYRGLWTTEPNPTKRTLTRLTSEENAALETLSEELPAPRLEQERIPFSVILEAINAQG